MRVPIAFQGEHGAFSEQAIKKFGEYHELGKHGIELEAVPRPNFDDLFAGIEEVGLGIVPVFNSTAGLVAENLKLILENRVLIVSEHYLRVRHCLLGVEGAIPQKGDKVYSHPQALKQCRNYLKGRELESVEAKDTAGAARWLSELKGEERLRNFAIAGKAVAEIYGLGILEEGI